MELRVREIDLARLEAEAQIVAALAHDIWTEYYIPIIGAAQVDYMLREFQSAARIAQDVRDKGFRYWIAEDGEVPIGYCGAVLESTRVFVSKIYILKSHRGRGVSRRFLETLESWRSEAQVPTIELTVNKYNSDTIAAYTRLGFVITQDLVADIGGGFVMDDYLMVRA